MTRERRAKSTKNRMKLSKTITSSKKRARKRVRAEEIRSGMRRMRSKSIYNRFRTYNLK